MEDPSLATEPTAPDDRSPGSFVHYPPSYKAAPPPFKPLDSPGAGTAAPPPPRPPGPVPIVPAAYPYPVRPAPPTRVVLTGDITALAPKPLPTVSLALSPGTGALGPTMFLVGVRPGGGEPFLFREAGSGEIVADDYARDYLARLRFQPPATANGETVWGQGRVRLGPGCLPVTARAAPC